MGKKYSESTEIKILALHKQHYLDQYTTEMNCDYSCWGYYDGISIRDIKEYKGQLFEKKSQAPVSAIWYGLGESIQEMNGLYSKQNVGIFREKSTKEDNTLEKQSIFFATSFIQLEDNMKSDETKKTLEALSVVKQKTKIAGDPSLADGKECSVQETYCKIVVYYTFDNTDIVALVYSDSLQLLNAKLEEIEQLCTIRYVHSIMGVSEEYLKESAQTGNSLSTWRGGSSHADETIDKIVMKIVTSNGAGTRRQVDEYMKGIFCADENPYTSEVYEQIRYSFISGHESLLVTIPNVRVQDLIHMLLPNNLITHQGTLYNNEVYNIETQLIMKQTKCENITTQDTSFMIQKAEDKQLIDSPKYYFSELTRKYAIQMKAVWEKGDEGLYSYYKALLQTVNTLSQYERFDMAKDIFYLIYPAFYMYDEKLTKALDELDKTEEYTLENIKESICDFVNAVNSIIYHVVHTDQVFLMIPGYTGTSFSIPIKLCLFYSSIIDSVTEILNDEGYKYTCLLAPEMETRPETTLISMKHFENDRLIHFALSQRTLYMPRHFMILLTHEIAHYVGNTIRMRKLRAEKIVKTIAYYLAEGIMPDAMESRYMDADERFIYNEFKKSIQKRIRRETQQILVDKIKANNETYNEHSTEIVRALAEGCVLLLSEDNLIYKSIYDISDTLQQNIIGREDIWKFEKKIVKLQNELNENRKKMLISDSIRQNIEQLVQLYKEMFSDVAAIVLLDCKDIQVFQEVFYVSEGNRNIFNTQSEVRMNIIKEILVGNDKRKNKEEKIESAQRKEGIYTYKWVEPQLMEYALECMKKIKERTEKGEYKSQIQKIQTIFEMFNSNRFTCNEIYCKMLSCINEYKAKCIKKMEENIDSQ